jgi:hypothetical protein
MHSDTRDRDSAFAILSEMATRVQRGDPGFEHITMHRVRFLAGNVQFRSNQLGEAGETFLPLVEQDGVEPETRTLAWLRIGQIHDLRLDRDAAVKAYRRSSDADPLSEAARQARQFLVDPYRAQNQAAGPGHPGTTVAPEH